MLLRDSEAARQVRVYLLDMEYLACTRPVDNSPVDSSVHIDGTALDDRIDQRITHMLGQTVVPMFNALIASSSEHRRELITLREDIQKRRAQTLLAPTSGSTLSKETPTDQVRSSLKVMTWQAFEHHVADLLRRDVVARSRGGLRETAPARLKSRYTPATRRKTRSDSEILLEY
ncbi:hypothetical protein OG920_22860 [Streptomyces europaeiscabiei]|uniref:hypothetical protein n=1 Tax=Streptomyces europaeiscabiei TaxID=146819 RepID=UPI00299FBCEB|nr:hypothetical protein [Streptomyces europaeiscabiei]MDX3632771.1 hypothetical protein [Streptomyces europaeiscabiei]MDX3654404.1 hypothetical protein [Streptomyces europaeiscabiei]